MRRRIEWVSFYPFVPVRPDSQIPKTSLTINRVVLIYFFVGSAWIILSSLWLSRQAEDTQLILAIEALKGMGYVLATTVLLWILCRFWSRQVTEALSKLKHTQSQYELYVKNSPIAISLIDKAGKFVEVNEATEKLTGYSPEELQQLSILDINVVDERKDTAAAFKDIFLDGYVTRDRTIKRKDGSEKIIRVDAVRHTEDRAILFSRDITDRKHDEQKLLMLNAMLRAIRRVNKAIVDTTDVDSLIRKICEILVEDREFKHAWIALLDEDGNPLHYHDAPQQKDSGKLKHFLQSGQLPHCIAGTKREGGLILAANPIEQCPNFPVMEGMEDCALLAAEFKFDNKVGYIALMTSQSAIMDEDEIELFREVAGDLRFALKSIQAEKERRRATEDLLIAKQAAEEANRVKGEFLSVMSHELRTPLNPIMGYTSLLMEEIDDPDCIRTLKEIHHSSETLLSLINDILFFSQLQEDPEAQQNAEFRLLESCTASLGKCRGHYPKQTIHIQNGTEDYEAIQQDTRVSGNIEFLQRILSALLCNACKYTHDGDIHLRLGQKNVGPEKLELLIEVEDSGIGIEQENLENLFAPFTQFDSSNTRRYKGVGLGLAICRKIADIMGGSLTAESQPNVGSCFRFTCTLDAGGPAKNPPRKTHPSKVAETARDGKVLLVEDNAANAFVAQNMLKRWGLQVDWAENGQSAVEMCQTRAYELVLMDLSMPVMNGLEATREILKPDAPNRETPIVGLTAHVSPDVQGECYAAGMAGFIPKPIKMAAFKDCIADYIRISE